MKWEDIVKGQENAPEDVRRKLQQMTEDVIEYREFVTQQSKANHFNNFDQSSFSAMSRMFDRILDFIEEIHS